MGAWTDVCRSAHSVEISSKPICPPEPLHCKGVHACVLTKMASKGGGHEDICWIFAGCRVRGRHLPGGHCKIGRASCRERVCQYVKIPVGAVSLKKKKEKI